MTVFVRPVFDEAGGHVVFALADPEDGDAVAGQSARVFVRRFRPPERGTAGEDPADGSARRRRRGCSECVSLAAFVAVFVLVLGGPGLVLAGIYVLWFLWLRAATG